MLFSVPSEIANAIETLTGSALIGFRSASGGCINQGGIGNTNKESFFLKWNDRRKYPGMFEAEAKGLLLLKSCTSLYVPGVIHVGSAGSFQFLLLEKVEEARRASDYWENLAVGLAQLHRTTADQFGLDHDNFIGALPQFNAQVPSWPEFFVEQRLRKQLRLAVDRRRIDERLSKRFELLFGKIDTLVIGESPSLLHGDLWSGNIMTNALGQPTLIDPAVYFGNREVDLAMTTLFGGFDSSFLNHYHEVYPLPEGYETRFHLYNLYPLLVHVNLFGGGYARQVEAVLSQFV